MKVIFYGAAGEVTGSCSILENNQDKLLVDCGMFQGGEFNEAKNSDPFPFNPAEISAVIVTHAHLDHTGRLPLLVKHGYGGFFYATPATIELTELILQDALTVMRYNNEKFGMPILYEESDVALVMEQFKAADYYESFVIPAHSASSGQAPAGIQTTYPRFHRDDSNAITVKFYEAGHIFGSVFAEVICDGRRVIFSGDIGNVNVPILRDTDILPDNLDLLVCESTYGDRLHESEKERQEILQEAVLRAVNRGGALMIPAFSLERTQELLYDLNDLIDRKQTLPRVPIFLDSPLAIGATRVYSKYTKYYDIDAERIFKSGDDLFAFPGLTATETKEESKRINAVPNPKIIIAGAGMMNGGRILHHALRYLSDNKSTLLIIGYQASGTLGRKILEGNTPVMVMGERISVKCEVRALGALSAHGDKKKLLEWVGGAQTCPKQVVLNHGEISAAQSLKLSLFNEFNLRAAVADKIGFEIEI